MATDSRSARSSSTPSVLAPVPVTRRAVLGGLASVASAVALGGCTPGQLVYVDSIKLRYQPQLTAPKSLYLRWDAASEVPFPEWPGATTAAADSPVCYNAAGVANGGGTVAIRARVRVLDIQADGTTLPWTGQVEVRASGGGMLGAIDALIVDVVDGISTPEYVTFDLPYHSIGSGGVRGVKVEDVSWQWETRVVGAPDFTATSLSNHRVYVVSRKPRDPWDNTSGSALNARTDALDIACSISATFGIADDQDEIATSLANLMNQGGGTCDTVNGSPSTTLGALMYDVAVATCHYATTTTIDLSAYIDRVNGGSGNGPLVNCTDCASLFSTLANLLGCNLWQGRIFTSEMNSVMPIGCGSWWVTSGYKTPWEDPGSAFLFYHEVAWKGDVALTSLIWDICYLMNGLADPLDPNKSHLTSRIIYYAWGIPFSGVAGGLDYREMLSRPVVNNVANTLPETASKIRRTPL